MKKLKDLLEENMRRFGTKNLSEDRLSSNADERAYDMVLSIIQQIAYDLDPDTVQKAIEDPIRYDTEDDLNHYETITKEIIPRLKTIAWQIQYNVERYNQ
jgi:hypothetical protein